MGGAAKRPVAIAGSQFAFQRLLEQQADVEQACSKYWVQLETTFREDGPSLAQSIMQPCRKSSSLQEDLEVVYKYMTPTPRLFGTLSPA